MIFSECLEGARSDGMLNSQICIFGKRPMGPWDKIDSNRLLRHHLSSLSKNNVIGPTELSFMCKEYLYFESTKVSSRVLVIDFMKA